MIELGPLTFEEPWWLLALLGVPVVFFAARRGLAVVRSRQHRRATIVRALVVALLAGALAAPRWESAGRAVDVAFLLDVSDSTGGRPSGAALTWLREALATMHEDDRAALALFGDDARLEFSLRPDPSAEPPAVIVNGSATDISRAMRLGQGVLGSKNRRRVVLLTDGRQTTGDAARTAAELAESGVHVDVVQLDGAVAADVLVEEVRAPGRAREGEAYDVVGVLRNTGDRAVEVVLVTSASAAGAPTVEVDRRTVTAAPGRTEVAVPRVATETGTVRYEMRLVSGASTTQENDVGRAAVRVDGPPQVLVYSGEQGSGDDLARALEARAIPTTLIEAASRSLPPLDALLDWDTVVLADVPAAALGEAGMQALDAFVRDAGHGLVVVGGDDAYGMGAYDATPLEELLPVFARVRDPKRRPSVAEALVVDVSGSMAACHCRADGFGGGVQSSEGGVNKTDITKEAVSRAADALEEQDIIGVLAFNEQAQWVLPLQSLPSTAVVDDAIAKLHPDGATNVVNAIRQAIAGLRDANARLRHIVLFTDGFAEDPEMVRVAQEAAAAGITLSVVATGEGTGEILRDMAEAGGGRYYPGRDLFSIPDIIVSEVQFAARPIITEGSFLPIVTGLDAATESLEQTPPLLGYIATTAKPTARQLLQIGEERDPLLATWQAGLGQVAAWTSDATVRWAQLWVDWDGYADFWSNVVRGTFPAQEDSAFSIDATATQDGIRIEVRAAGGVGADAPAAATVTDPDGNRIDVPLERTGLGSWEGLAPVTTEGITVVQVTLGPDEAPIHRGVTTAIRSYPVEYAVTAAEADLAQRVVDAGRGRLDPPASEAFLAEGLVPGSSSREVWAPLVLLAMLGLVTDVGLRRLRLERGDLRRLLAWMAFWKRTTSPEELAAASERTSALREARARAREEQLVRTGAGAPPSPAGPERGGGATPPAPGAAPTPPPAPTPKTPKTPGTTPPPPAEAEEGGVSGLLAARKKARQEPDD